MGEIVTSGESEFWKVELEQFKNYLFDAIGAIDGRDLAKEDTYDGDLTWENADIVRNLVVGGEPAGVGEVPAQLLDIPGLRVWGKRRLGGFCKYPRYLPDRNRLRR